MVETIARFSVPVVLYVHNLETTLPLYEKIKDQLAAVISNSSFMAQRIEELWAVKCHVVYPVPDWKQLDADPTDGEFITFFNPSPHKGLGVVHPLVMNRFPDRPFLFVEGFIDPEQHGISLQRSGNLVQARRSPDVATIYSMSRLVIIPSQWEEPFGRIALEAMACRVPVIASHTGGLPESVGRGGILLKNFSDVDCWADAILGLDNEKERKHWIAMGRKHVKQFSLSEQVEKLIGVLKSVATA
jgi:glycosyltransferase involved in cell wall biosynthesis